eukprot:TRINITY_DN576_c1_g3_i3.p1 TRINITY_DN576_c1_g3~~TRINITY_DN576_c1_g3_i3.p1  ORF type:complete len:118 (+),score=50.90 TRINITY_DN576_c1_g3_i3:142-495(+)
MLTGESPCPPDVDKNQLKKQVGGGWRPTIPRSTPTQWEGLIQKCWDQTPTERPSFEKIVENLKPLQSSITPPDTSLKNSIKNQKRKKNTDLSSSMGDGDGDGGDDGGDGSDDYDANI